MCIPRPFTTFAFFSVVNSGHYKNGDTFDASATGNSYKIQYYTADTRGARGYCSFDINVKGMKHFSNILWMSLMLCTLKY